MSTKTHPNGPYHHEIVHLEAGLAVRFTKESFDVPSNFTYTFTSYDRTTPSEVQSRVATATVIITNLCKITAETLSPEKTPCLQCVAVVATGTDCVDLNAAKKRGIYVINSPSASTESVSEHTLALYFAVRRKIIQVHNRLYAGDGREWVRQGTMRHVFNGEWPRTCSREVLGIVGHGNLGQRIEMLAKGLGMSVLIADRKFRGPGTPPPGRLSFNHVLSHASVIVICCPLTAETRNLISDAELELMLPDAILINVGRGGIVDERALAKVLKEGRIGGAATDVFEQEPTSREQTPLLEKDIPNFVASPHLAWNAESTITTLKNTVQANVSCFVKGQLQNVVIGTDS